MNKYVDTSKVSVRQIDTKVAKELIMQNHYSHKWTSCKFPLGIFYEQEHPWFGLSEKLIGCIVYGYPVGRQTADSISPYVVKGDVLELTRLWVADGYGANIESYAIGQSFRWLKKNAPRTKCLISYSDPEYGHAGTIYQATNWLYQGRKTMRMDAHSFLLTPGSKWLHQRAINARYGRVGLKNLTEKIRTPFWRKEDIHKHRYIHVLCTGKMKKNILRTLKHPILSYPKPTDKVIPKVEQIDLVNGKITITPMMS